MLAKYSNPSCSAPFRHLQDGTMTLRISGEKWYLFATTARS